jgi:integrase
MAKKLTDIAIRNLRPDATRREVADGGCRGLYLVLQPSGRKSFAVRYRFGGKTRKLTLDGRLTLAEARKQATAALHELERGKDPAVLKFDAAAAQAKAVAEREADSVDRWVKDFLEYQRKRVRENTLSQCEHALRLVLAKWGGRVVHDIKRRDVIELVEGAVEARGPIAANRVHSYTRRFFSWLCERDVIGASPCTGVKPPSKERARDRILDDSEIKQLWAACDAIGDPAGAAIKLLLLTGARLAEVTGMRRSEISDDVWVLPPERTKNATRHEVPLSRQALATIESVPVFAGREDHVFPPASMARVKVAVDSFMRPAAPYVLHDLRRTCASGMARLGIPLPVVERCLNHKSGSFRGIVGVYQRHDFAAEKLDALQRWADHVDAIVRGEPTGKVVKARFGQSA